MKPLLSFVAGVLISGVTVTTVAPIREVFSNAMPVIDAVTALASTGNFTSATCTISANPITASRSSEPIALTFTATNTFAKMEFNGVQIQSGYTTTVYPTETTTYSALLNDGFGCKYTVEVTAPSAGGICSRSSDVSAPATGDVASDIQQFLIDQNYPIQKSGAFDARTQTALKLFQLEKVATVGENIRAVATGVWDARTRAVVFGLYGCKAGVVTATAPSATATGISAPAANSDKVCLDKFIKPGVTNGDVIAIQTFLNTQNVSAAPLETTGYYGGGTKTAVKKFQEDNAADILTPNDLTKGNGIWGPSTAKKASALGLCGFTK
jgi:hypothetical protein